MATLRVHHLDGTWGLRGVRVKGGNRRDIPLPAVVMQFLRAHVDEVLCKQVETVEPDTPLFVSSWGRRGVGRTRAPMIGKNIWRLCKVYGRIIGCPELKPHDLRHGVAMEVLEQHHDLEQVPTPQALGVVLRGAGDASAQRDGRFSRKREGRETLNGFHGLRNFRKTRVRVPSTRPLPSASILAPRPRPAGRPASRQRRRVLVSDRDRRDAGRGRGGR